MPDESSKARTFKVLLRNPFFILYLISSTCTGLGIYIFGSFVPEFANITFPELSSTQTAIIVSAMGVGSFAGRLIFSSLAATSPRAPLTLFILSLALCGVSNGLIPLCTNYGLLVFNSAIQGMFFGKSSLIVWIGWGYLTI